jgi:hypothetical protein
VTVLFADVIGSMELALQGGSAGADLLGEVLRGTPVGCRDRRRSVG